MLDTKDVALTIPVMSMYGEAMVQYWVSIDVGKTAEERRMAELGRPLAENALVAR